MFYDLRWERDLEAHASGFVKTAAGATILVSGITVKEALNRAIEEVPDDADRIWIKRNKHLAKVKL